VVGFVWNLAVARWLHEQNPVPGAFYTTEGLPMHIDCRGTGSPAIVLEAAASAPWSEWRLVQQCLIDMAPSLAQSDPTFEQQATNLVDNRCATHHPTLPYAMQGL
jgi:hypothetical protein